VKEDCLQTFLLRSIHRHVAEVPYLPSNPGDDHVVRFNEFLSSDPSFRKWVSNYFLSWLTPVDGRDPCFRTNTNHIIVRIVSPLYTTFLRDVWENSASFRSWWKEELCARLANRLLSLNVGSVVTVNDVEIERAIIDEWSTIFTSLHPNPNPEEEDEFLRTCQPLFESIRTQLALFSEVRFFLFD
jgi:hypothetical protein